MNSQGQKPEKEITATEFWKLKVDGQMVANLAALKEVKS